jgi:hypothetical protein
VTVEVIIRRGTAAATVRRTVLGAPARQLAGLINSLPMQKPDTMTCSVDLGFRDELLFRSGASLVQVTVKPDGCGWVQLEASRRTGADQVDAAVLIAVGLPAGYGH